MASGGAMAVLLRPRGGYAQDDVVLTLRNPRITGRHGVVTFSRQDLETMPWAVLRTTNDFIDGEGEFRGPRAEEVLDMIGRAGATHVRLKALNEYEIEIEIDELKRFGAVLALEMNGERLTRRDKGPIWLMYPIDSYSELQDSVYNNRLVWQLKEIELF